MVGTPETVKEYFHDYLLDMSGVTEIKFILRFILLKSCTGAFAGLEVCTLFDNF